MLRTIFQQVIRGGRHLQGGEQEEDSPSSSPAVESSPLVRINFGRSPPSNESTTFQQPNPHSNSAEITFEMIQEQNNYGSGSNRNNSVPFSPRHENFVPVVDDEEAQTHGDSNLGSNSNSNANGDEYQDESSTENRNDNENETDGNTTGPDFLSRTRRRLHCLFIFFTCPIIPLVTALVIFLGWVLYAAFLGTDEGQCREPLRTFAYMSTCLFIYTPNHKKVKRLISQRYRATSLTNSNNSTNPSSTLNSSTTNSSSYHSGSNVRSSDSSTTRNGTNNEENSNRDPAIERIYDHLYLCICLLYMYLGITWTENCRADDDEFYGCNASNPSLTTDALNFASSETGISGSGLDTASNTGTLSPSSCEFCGCPNLYHATNYFVMTLSVLATVLVLPLLCLPCVYVWIVRGATQDAIEAARSAGGRGIFDDENLLSRWTVDQVLDQMEQVYRNSVTKEGEEYEIEGSSSYQSLPQKDQKNSMKMNNGEEFPRECCICMSELCYAPSKHSSLPHQEKAIIRTKCGHVFHRDCLGGWLRGNWDVDNTSNDASENSNSRVRATRRVCPLCRDELVPESSPPPSPSPSPPPSP